MFSDACVRALCRSRSFWMSTGSPSNGEKLGAICRLRGRKLGEARSGRCTGIWLTSTEWIPVGAVRWAHWFITFLSLLAAIPTPSQESQTAKERCCYGRGNDQSARQKGSAYCGTLLLCSCRTGRKDDASERFPTLEAFFGNDEDMNTVFPCPIKNSTVSRSVRCAFCHDPTPCVLWPWQGNRCDRNQ